jgi:hypothetical protein
MSASMRKCTTSNMPLEAAPVGETCGSCDGSVGSGVGVGGGAAGAAPADDERVQHRHADLDQQLHRPFFEVRWTLPEASLAVWFLHGLDTSRWTTAT